LQSVSAARHVTAGGRPCTGTPVTTSIGGQSAPEFARCGKSKTRDGQSSPLDGLSPDTAALGAEVDAIVGWFGRANISQQTFSLGVRWDFHNGFALKAQPHRHGRGLARLVEQPR